MIKNIVLTFLCLLTFPLSLSAENYDYLNNLTGKLTIHCSESEQTCQSIVEKFNNEVSKNNGNLKAELLIEDKNEFINRMKKNFLRHQINSRRECEKFSSSSQLHAKESCKESLYQTKVDIIMLGTENDYKPLFSMDAVSRYNFPSDNLHKWSLDLVNNTDNRLGGISMNMIGLAVNTNNTSSIPKCWSNLKDSQYKQKISMTDWRNSNSSYLLASALFRAYEGAEEAGWELLKNIHKNTIKYSDSDMASIDSVINTNSIIAIAFSNDVLRLKAQGKPINFVTLCEGSPYEVASIGILRGSANRKAAEAFVNFTYDMDIQNLVSQPTLHSFPANKSADQPKDSEGLKNDNLLYYLKRFSLPSVRKKVIEQWENNIFQNPR